MKRLLSIALVLAAAQTASAITTTLEYEDLRETESRAAISNDISRAVSAAAPDFSTSNATLVATIEATAPAPDFSPSNAALVATIEATAPEPDFTTSNATLVATIEATAPAPGNYAVVSNKAMTALQSFTETDPNVPSWAKVETPPYLTEHQSLTNYYTKTQTESFMAPEWTPGAFVGTSMLVFHDHVLYKCVVAHTSTVFKPSYFTVACIRDVLDLKASSYSPYFTGQPTAPDIGANTRSQVATKNYVDASVPTKVSTFANDAGYLTQHQSLTNYTTKSETSTAMLAATNHTEALVAQMVPLEPVVQFVDKGHVRVLGGFPYLVGAARVYVETNATVDVAAALDAGAIAPGTDYFVHLTAGGAFVVSTNAEIASARAIGGFHTICRTVPADLQMAPVSVFAGALHPLAGWTAGDILPKSVWAMNFRPQCPDPTGMVYVREADTWVDIYNASGSIYAPESKFGGSRIHTKSQIAFMTGFGNVGKQLLNDEEFWFAAVGSNVGTHVAGAAQPNPDTTGGRNDTANYPMISAVGCEEMCGLQVQWLRDTHANSGGSWDNASYPTVAYDGGNNSFGSNFAMQNYRAVYAGGSWASGTVSACGPLCRSASFSRSYVSVSFGGRGSSRSTRMYTTP